MPMKKPITARRWVTCSPSTSRRCTAWTLSRIVMAGKRGPWNGSGVLLGKEDRPLPNSSLVTRNSLLGSSALPGPISQSWPCRSVM